MTDPTLLDLLHELITFLRTRGDAGRQPGCSRDCGEFADRIEVCLAVSSASTAPDDVLAATRSGWRADNRVRFDDAAVMRLDADGMWIAGWILAASRAEQIGEVGSRRYHLALAALPLMPQEVLRLHCEQGLDYPAIGRRLGIATAEVQQHLVEALVAIDGALGPG